MFNITDNFQPLTDEQLTEVTGGGLGTTVSSVPVAGSLLGSTVTGLGQTVGTTVTDVNGTLTSTTTALTTGLVKTVTDATA